LYFSELGI